MGAICGKPVLQRGRTPRMLALGHMDENRLILIALAK